MFNSEVKGLMKTLKKDMQNLMELYREDSSMVPHFASAKTAIKQLFNFQRQYRKSIDENEKEEIEKNVIKLISEIDVILCRIAMEQLKSFENLATKRLTNNV